MTFEIFRPLKGYKEFYLVSNYGRIWSIKRNHFLRATKDHDGYLQVDLRNHGSKRMRKVHRLVLQTFIPNPQSKPYCNHKDGNKQNNHVDNLEWVTAKENSQHARKTGLFDNAANKLRQTYKRKALLQSKNVFV